MGGAAGPAEFGDPWLLSPDNREEMVNFSSPPPLPKSKGFPFLVCEMKEGNLGKGCGQSSAHTPNIPLPTSLSSVWGKQPQLSPQMRTVVAERKGEQTPPREAWVVPRGVGSWGWGADARTSCVPGAVLGAFQDFYLSHHTTRGGGRPCTGAYTDAGELK